MQYRALDDPISSRQFHTQSDYTTPQAPSSAVLMANPPDTLDTAIVRTPPSQPVCSSLDAVVCDIQPGNSNSFPESAHLEFENWALDGAFEEDENFWSRAIQTAWQDELDITNDSTVIGNQDQETLKSLGSTIAMSEVSTVLSDEHQLKVTAVEEAQQHLNDVVRELAYAISEARINQLSHDLVVLKREHQSLREQLDKMIQRWSEHEANLQAARHEVQQTKDELASTRNMYELMAKELSLNRKRLTECEMELSSASDQLKQSQNQHRIMKSKFERTETCLTHMRQSLGKLDEPAD